MGKRMRSRNHAAAQAGRQEERHPLEVETRLKPNSWSSLSIRMLDVSSAGFRAECEARVLPGACVTLAIPGIGEVDAQVEWQRREEFGARFLAPLDLDRCEWSLGDANQALARLLVQRASAKQVGRNGAEADLRRRILRSLPMRKGLASG